MDDDNDDAYEPNHDEFEANEMADRRNAEHIINHVEQLSPQPLVVLENIAPVDNTNESDDHELEFNQFDVAGLLGELKFK